MMQQRFLDRHDAGRKLADELRDLAQRRDVVVLALPRGGVPVASEVAHALGAPLDVFVVRKLGVPGQEELAMGAIASGGTRVINDEVVELLRISPALLDSVAAREARELERREQLYRAGREPLSVQGRVVVLVDDGIATGSTMLAAVQALRQRAAAEIIVAVPVCAITVADRVRRLVDRLVCVVETTMLDGVSAWYEDFEQTSDAEVSLLLAAPDPALPRQDDAPAMEQSVTIAAGGVVLAADLVIPPQAQGLVIFAHGSGSGRRSSRNRHVAAVLQRGALATLLLDLLTADEERIDERTAHLRFDIGLLTGRLVAATDWAVAHADLRQLDIGLFGASTGAAAALFTAARRPGHIRAVVSRGGRPDLAGDALRLVRAPVLLIVGGRDFEVLEMNREALRALHGPRQLEIVPEATHLFEEPGALERVARLALDWFRQYLGPHARGPAS
jgi:putative phosphoribosyl transferase